MKSITLTFVDQSDGGATVVSDPDYKDLLHMLSSEKDLTAGQRLAVWTLGEIYKEIRLAKAGKPSPIIIPKAHRMW
jgi:hypothetical protein